MTTTKNTRGNGSKKKNKRNRCLLQPILTKKKQNERNRLLLPVIKQRVIDHDRNNRTKQKHYSNSVAWHFSAAQYVVDETAAFSLSLKSCAWGAYPCHKVRLLSSWRRLEGLRWRCPSKPGHGPHVPAPPPESKPKKTMVKKF